MKNNVIIIITLLVSFTSNLPGQVASNFRPLISGQFRDAFPSWAPDGKTIVFQRTDYNDTVGKNGLWKINLDGTATEQIFAGVAEHPRWSPDGEYIVFDADTGQNIKLIHPRGGAPISFLPDSIRIFRGGLPCWSPDAQKIAFVEGSTLWLCTYDFQTAELNRIYREEGKVPLPGCWTPDGKDILIAPMDLQSRKSTLLKISSDGKEKMQITGHHENLYRHLALSPDGTLIVYAAMVDRFLELFIMPADGGISLPLEIAYEGHKEGQCWSPDGSTLALGFSGNIWLMDLDLERARKELRLQEK